MKTALQLRTPVFRIHFLRNQKFLVLNEPNIISWILNTVVWCVLLYPMCVLAQSTPPPSAGDCSHIQPRITPSQSCTNVCAGTAIILDAGEGFAQYTWSNGVRARQLFLSSSEQSGSYSCTIVTDQGCRVTTAPMNVSINTPAEKPYIIQQENRLVSTEATSYTWLHNNQLLANETQRSILVTQPGEYRVIATNDRGCTAKSDGVMIAEIIHASIPKNGRDARLRVYPNPTSGTIAVQLVSVFEGDIAITVHSLDGKLIYESTWQQPKPFDILSIELHQQSNGTYILTARDGIDTVTEKIVKQN